MKKQVAAVLLSLLVSSFVAVIFFLPHTFTKATVGTALYEWYGALPNDDWVNATKYVDFPVPELGALNGLDVTNYNSLNKTAVGIQVRWIGGAGFDFALISWWGKSDNDSSVQADWRRFVDNASKLVFQTLQELKIDLKLAIMVEPYLKENVTYDYNEISNYIYSEFVLPYPDIYYKVDNKPLICFFNDNETYRLGLTPNGPLPDDPRFTEILVGDQKRTQWTYTSNEVHTNQIGFYPRIDDSGVRIPSTTIDVDLTKGTYDIGWQNAIQLWRQGKVDTILIASWNEYPERTEIEPHYDRNYNETMYGNATYYLYNKTRDYISQVQGPSLTDTAVFALEFAATFAVTCAVFFVVATGIMKSRNSAREKSNDARFSKLSTKPLSPTAKQALTGSLRKIAKSIVIWTAIIFGLCFVPGVLGTLLVAAALGATATWEAMIAMGVLIFLHPLVLTIWGLGVAFISVGNLLDYKWKMRKRKSADS